MAAEAKHQQKAAAKIRKEIAFLYKKNINGKMYTVLALYRQGEVSN